MAKTKAEIEAERDEAIAILRKVRSWADRHTTIDNDRSKGIAFSKTHIRSLFSGSTILDEPPADDASDDNDAS